MKIILISIIAFLLIVQGAFAQGYDEFKQEFIHASQNGISEEKLNDIFAKYTNLVFPEFSTSKLVNEMKGQEIAKFPLENLKEEPFYATSITKLLHSDDPNERILSYLTLGSANDPRFNDVLRARLKTDKNKGSKLWACVALLYMGDNHTSELFDFLVENEDFSDAHLVPLFFDLDKASLQKTAYENINSDNKTARVLAVQILSVTGLTPKTDILVRKAVESWDFDSKGYAIYTMKQLKMGKVKESLAPLLSHKEMRAIALEALANSPTPEDREFLFSLHANKDEVPADILDAYFNSQNPDMVGQWLHIVRERKIPGDYIFFVFKQPLLLSDEFMGEVKETIRKTKNVKILQELPRALAGRTDKESVDLLIDLTSHPDETVRYWAAFSLKNTTSKKLASVVPVLVKKPNLRTVALVDILLSNRVDNVQEVFEKFWEQGNDSSLDWRRASIKYLSTFPNMRHRKLFRKIIQDVGEDTFVKRHACLGLGKLRDESSVDAIISAMKEESDSDHNVMTYLVALGQIKGTKAKQIVESYKDSSDQQVKKLVHQIIEEW